VVVMIIRRLLRGHGLLAVRPASHRRAAKSDSETSQDDYDVVHLGTYDCQRFPKL